jgi:hypothetical protein
MDFLIIGFLLLGVAFGFLLRRVPRVVPVTARLASGTVYGLVFLLGASVGANPAVMANLGRFGLQALVLCLGGVLGSLILARLVSPARSAVSCEE